MCGRMRIVFTLFTFYYYTLCLSTSEIAFDGQRTEERENIIPDTELNYQQLFKEGHNLADEYYEYNFDDKNLNKEDKEENLSNNLQNFSKNKDFTNPKQTKFFKKGNFYTNNERNSMGTDMVRNSTSGIKKRISKRSPTSQDTQNQGKHLPNDISDFLKYFFNNIENSATNAKLQREVVNNMIRTAQVSEINNLARNAKVTLFMKFGMPFKPQYSDPLSQEFQEVNRTLWEELVPAMNKSMNNKLFGFTLKKLTPGSTNAESEVETTEEAAEEGQVKSAAQEAAEKNSTSYPMDSNSVEQKYEPQYFVISRINLTVTDRKYVEGMCDVTSRSFDKEYNDTISSSIKKFGGEGIINVTVVSCTSGSVKTVAEINSTEYSARNKKAESGLKEAAENGNISYSVDPTTIVQYQWNDNSANAPNNFTMTNASSNFTITRVNMTILDKTYVEGMCDRNSKTFDKDFNDTMIKLIWEFGGSGIQDVTIVNCSLESDYLKTVVQIRSSPESAKNKSVETGLKQAAKDGKVPYKIDPQTIVQYDYSPKAPEGDVSGREEDQIKTMQTNDEAMTSNQEFEKTVKTILKFRIENLTHKEGMCDSQSQNYDSTFVNKISRMVERYGGDGVKSSKVTKCSSGSVATENEVESTEESAANKDAEKGMQEAANNETEYKIDSESVSQSDPITNGTTTTIQPSMTTKGMSEQNSGSNAGNNTSKPPSMTTGSNSMQNPASNTGNNTSKPPSMTTGSNSMQNPASNAGNNTSKPPSITTGSNSMQNPASNTGASSDEKLVPVILRFGITNVEFKEGMCDPNDKRNFNKTFVDKVNDMVLKHCGPGVKETNVKSCSAGSVMTENEMNSTESSANNRSAENGMKDAASKNETAYQVDQESVEQVEPSQTESTSTTTATTSLSSGSGSSTKSSSDTTKSDSSSETTTNDHSSSSKSSTTSKDSITDGLARTPTTQSSSKSDTTDKNSMFSSTKTSDTSDSQNSNSTSSSDSQDDSFGSSGSSSSSSSWVSQAKNSSTTSDDSSSETQKSTTKTFNSHTSSSTMENSEGSFDQTSVTRPSHSTSDSGISDSGGTSDGASDSATSGGTTGGSSDETSDSGTSGSGSSDGTSSSGTSGGSSGSGSSGGSSGSGTSGGSSGSGTSGGSSGSGTSGGSSGSGTSGGSSGSGTSGGSSGSGTSGGSSGSGTDSTAQERKFKIEYLYFKHPNMVFNLKTCTNGTDEFKKFKEQMETQYRTGLSKVMGSKFFSIEVLECSEGSVDMKTQTNTTGDADTVDAMIEYAESTSGETEIDPNTVRVTSQPHTVISFLDLKLKNSYQDGMCDRNSEHNEVQKMRDYNQTITQELNENLGSHFINITDVYCTKASTEDNSVIFTFKMNVTAESAKNLEESKVMGSYFKSQDNKNYVGVYQCQEDDPYGAGACTQQNGEAGMNGNSDLDDDAPDNLNSDYDSNSNKIIIMDYFYKITLPVAVGVIIVVIIFLCATSGSTLSKTSANKQV